MGLLDDLKRALGFTTARVGELNRSVDESAHKVRRSVDALTGQVKRSSEFFDSIEDIEVIPEYQKILQLVSAGNPLTFVSGRAGTGKSTLIRYIRHEFKGNWATVAPTGVAALNVQGSTIHSFFRFPPRIITSEDIKPLPDRKLFAKLQLLIVDEISMVRADLMDGIDRFLRVQRGQKNIPFGGVSVLVIGDLFQLPPVTDEEEQRVLINLGYSSGFFFFSAKLLENQEIDHIELTRVFRQKDSAFIDILDQVRVGERLSVVLPLLNSRVGEKIVNQITLCSTNKDADQINKDELMRLQSEAKVFIGRFEGKFPKDKRVPSPDNLTLKNDSMVMFTKNDVNKRWVNGTLGKIRTFGIDSISVEVTSDENKGMVFDVQKVSWDYYEFVFNEAENKIKPIIVGRYIQYPLMLAWAITIHKSQGKTIENIHIDLGNGAFASGQVYVALSRCRVLERITLGRAIRESDVKVDPRVKRFFSALHSNGSNDGTDEVEDNLPF